MEQMLNPVKRVAAIHDLSGFGRASLTVVTPILSSMGIQVCPLPTAVLSTHSHYKNFHFVDLTDHLQPIIDHWKQLDLSFHGIYSGFLGSHRQIAIVEQFINDFRKPNTLVVVDPVLGDNGRIYTPLNQQVVVEMRRLIFSADIITPNITELCLLLDIPYKNSFTIDEIKQGILTLAGKGPRIVIVTSVPEPERPNYSSVIAYSSFDKRFWKVTCNYLPASFPGTGDTFSSVITGSLLQGDSLPIALDRAVQFASMGVRATFGYSYNPAEGILLERILPALNAPVFQTTYELMD